MNTPGPALKVLQTSSNGGDLIRRHRTVNNSDAKLKKLISSPRTPSLSKKKTGSHKSKCNTISKFLKPVEPASKRDTRDVAVSTESSKKVEQFVQTLSLPLNIDRATFLKPLNKSNVTNEEDRKLASARMIEALTCEQEPICVEYWRSLAEAKKTALNESLKENLQIHQEIADLREYVRTKEIELKECQEYIDVWRSALDEYQQEQAAAF